MSSSEVQQHAVEQNRAEYSTVQYSLYIQYYIGIINGYLPNYADQAAVGGRRQQHTGSVPYATLHVTHRGFIVGHLTKLHAAEQSALGLVDLPSLTARSCFSLEPDPEP